MGPKLQVSKDYSLFEIHEFNRPLHEDPALEQSMVDHGFMPSSPIHCVRASNGKLKIIRGHHRFDYAKKLKLPIWYIIDESKADLFDLEGSSLQRWSIIDFVKARAHAGDKDCAALLAFKEKHGLTIGASASLLGGQSAGSANKTKEVRRGTFKLGDPSHAHAVTSITDRCREKRVSFATSSAFVSAVSLALRVPEFDQKIFLHRVEVDAAKLRKRGTVDEYLEEIDALYNYQAKKRIPLAFRAREVSKDRQDTFGRKNK